MKKVDSENETETEKNNENRNFLVNKLIYLFCESFIINPILVQINKSDYLVCNVCLYSFTYENEANSQVPLLNLENKNNILYTKKSFYYQSSNSYMKINTHSKIEVRENFSEPSSKILYFLLKNHILSCKNEFKGCKWKGKYSLIEEHMRCDCIVSNNEYKLVNNNLSINDININEVSQFSNEEISFESENENEENQFKNVNFPKIPYKNNEFIRNFLEDTGNYKKSMSKSNSNFNKSKNCPSNFKKDTLLLKKRENPSKNNEFLYNFYEKNNENIVKPYRANYKIYLTCYNLQSNIPNWTIHIIKQSKPIGIGVVNKNILYSKMFLPSSSHSHGSFIISSNGRIWNCNNKLEDNTTRPFRFKENSIIEVSYNKVKACLFFKITNFVEENSIERCFVELNSVLGGDFRSNLSPVIIFECKNDEGCFKFFDF